MTAAIALVLLAVALTCAAFILRLIIAQARLEQRWADDERRRFNTRHPNIRSPR